MTRTFQSFSIAFVAAAVAASVTLGGCTTLAGSDGMTRTATVAPGSTFSRMIRDSGSYGNGASTTTVTRAANRDWKGEMAGVWQQAAGPTLLLRPADGAFLAFLNGEQPAVSFEPALGWPFPLEVGKRWTRNVTMTLHASSQRVPLEASSVVEAHEDVSVPAGTFKAWRVRTADNVGNEDVNWFSTDLTVFVKQRLTRTVRHAAGPGVRETELLSQNIRHR